MFENIDWFQESSISFLTTDSSAWAFFDTLAVVLPCNEFYIDHRHDSEATDLKRCLQLTKGHWKITALGEELPPLSDVSLEQRLLLLVREDAGLGLRYEVQDILPQSTINFWGSLKK